MKYNRLVMLCGLLIGLSFSCVAETVSPAKQVVMDIVVVEMSAANFEQLQKEQYQWQDNADNLIRLLKDMQQQSKEAITIAVSQVKVNDNEAITVMGDANRVSDSNKGLMDAAHQLVITPKVIAADQVSVVIQDQKIANKSAQTGGVSFQKVVGEKVVLFDKKLALIAVVKQPEVRQLVFITPTIVHE